ncbi:sigma-70 family RNA polymerase sigma factor [Kitasatospora purpeofusca]|uniref:sigma-70 family RNA polymerase sigma factor n=1 Tax=Kitasatospora purpeofusca TaxID=67352 RepID=UPI00224D7834|nr:sigma-70 family RNA polymerase sigma factor [Kitasatospora purpeofusca]MCX4687317.1 sigma-70 family RNA polymerase sigma factor [Kitasatospora purpeofusca]
MSATVSATVANESADFAATVAAAQTGDSRAIEAVLAELEGAVIYYAHKRAERTANGHAFREDMQQEARIAILEALRDYSPKAGVKFTTYAIQRLKGAVSDEAFAQSVPGVPVAAAKTFTAAIRECGGDQDAAEALVQNLPDANRRLSRDLARAVRFSLAPSVSFDSMEPDDADTTYATKFLGDRMKSPQDRWAETQGKASEGLRLERDDARDDRQARKALVEKVLLPKLSPTQRKVINHVYGTEGAAWLVKIDTKRIGMRGADVTPDYDAIAESVGSNRKSVNVLKSQGLAKLRKAFGDFEDALTAADVLSI